MDNNNNNQIFGVDGWPDDVYGFLRGKQSSGLNLWVTFLLEKKVKRNDTNAKKQQIFTNSLDQNKRNEDEEDVVYQEEVDDNPYIRLYTDCEDWGFGNNMPEAWRR